MSVAEESSRGGENGNAGVGGRPSLKGPLGRTQSKGPSHTLQRRAMLAAGIAGKQAW